MAGGFTFAGWLKHRRRLLDLTQQELASRVGCSVVTIRKLETGERKPSKQLTALLAAQLKVPADEWEAFESFARADPADDQRDPAPPAQAAPWRSEPRQEVREPAAGAGLLAQPGTPFVGRAVEQSEIAAYLAQPECRLLTLVGPGGIGKTRLALEVAAAQHGRFEHGVYFASLGSLSSPDHLLPAIANAVGYSFGEQADSRQQLLRFLARRTLLLVLDNFEHLLPPDTQQNPALTLIADILAQARQVRLLVTSRERLMLQGEWTYDLSGMRYPAANLTYSDDQRERWLDEYSALKLFVLRAQRVSPGFTLDATNAAAVLRICRAVEGMPLGIELATTWLQALSAADIADEIEESLTRLSTHLRDMPERHRQLSNVFEYSWQRLSAAEQILLKQLAVFRGSFDRSAAQEVAGASPAGLASLVSKSLLRHTNGRYDLHELIRQAGLEKLQAEGGAEAATRSRHSEHYCRMLQHLEPLLRGQREAEALRRIEADIDNVRAAWQWAVGHREIAAIERALSSLAYFYFIRSWYQEGRQALSQALEQVAGAEGAREQLLEARLRARLATMLQYLGRLPQAEELLSASLATAQRLAASHDIAYALCQRGNVAMFADRLAQAAQHFEHALELYQALGNRHGMIECLDGLSWAASYMRDFDRADLYHHRNLELLREDGPRSVLAWTLIDMATTLRMRGRYQEAARHAARGLRACREVDYPFAQLSALEELGLAAQALGRYAEAARHFQAGADLRARLGETAGTSCCLALLAAQAAELKDWALAESCLQQLLALHDSHDLGEIAYGYYLYGQGQYELRQARPASAAILFGESIRILRPTRVAGQALLAQLGLGHALYALGEYQQARQQFQEALREALDGSWAGAALEAAGGLARLMAVEGDRSRAATLLRGLQQHPAGTYDTRQRAAQALAELQSEQPSALAELPDQPAPAIDLATLARELL